MQVQVRYFTRSGNTQKLAEAIAKAVHTPAQSVEVPLTEPTDVLFLGCSYYGFDVDEHIKAFIAQNKPYIGKIVCFGTSAMMRSTYKPMKKVADAAGVALVREDFHCRGSFGWAHKGRPNQEDLRQAADFALRIVKED